MRANSLMLAAGVGCGIGYFFDSRSGRRRRAMVRDKLARGQRIAGGVAGIFRDLRNRTEGLIDATRSRASGPEVTDQVCSMTRYAPVSVEW